MADKDLSDRSAHGAEAGRHAFADWSRVFLGELAATSNVSAAARMAGVYSFVVYETRRNNAEFNRKWQEALCEGYDHLEMALLFRLRVGEISLARKRGKLAGGNRCEWRMGRAGRKVGLPAERQLDIRDAARRDAGAQPRQWAMAALLGRMEGALDSRSTHRWHHGGRCGPCRDQQSYRRPEGCGHFFRNLIYARLPAGFG